MHHKNILWVSMLALGLSTTTYAQDALNANDKESLKNSLSIEANQTTDTLDNVTVDAENIATDNNEQADKARHPRLEGHRTEEPCLLQGPEGGGCQGGGTAR